MKPQKPRDKKSKVQNVVVYSSVAFEMAATIVISVFIGKYLDNQFELVKPIFTAIFSIIGVVGSIYNLIRKVTKK